MPKFGKLLFAAIVGLSIVPLWTAFSTWSSDDLARFVCYLGMSIVASGLKVALPGITGTMSVNFLFVLIGITEMRFGETLWIGCLGGLIQCLWRSRLRAKPVQVLFSVCNMALAVAVAYRVYHWPLLERLNHDTPALLGVTAVIYFFFNTAPIAAIVSVTERKPMGKTWQACYFWSFPFYLVGASIAWVLDLLSRQIHWQGAILLLPVIYFIYRSYRIYLDRLETEKKHVEEMAGLHLRTIEALALAIEAKDHTTHEHLCRVRTYAVEIGKDLGLADSDLEALRAAALLHDIGKLAVPEHIISKPGRLTPEEFEKMKIHPLVGAEILERVNFPYPVAPIVRAHHEHFDGTGYPYGLKGEQIPIGARILSAVDQFDALASDRQYRRAMPLEEAIQQVARESGHSLDPAIVAILARRYPELEEMAKRDTPLRGALLTDLKITRGQAPAAGFEEPAAAPRESCEFLSSIAAARQEVQLLFELTRDVGTSLSLDDTLSVLAVRLRRMVPYDAMVVYIRREERLVPTFVSGEDFRLFSSLDIPLGEGISGWVAENGKPMLNADPSLELTCLKDPDKCTHLQSALAVPLEGLDGTVGALSVYRAGERAFTQDNLRILLAISGKVSFSIENALKYRQAEDSATTDYLTGLANARSLFLRLDSEVARSKRAGSSLAVLVCDLNGFKQINDRFGHLEGNRLLRDVAHALRANCREYDYVARMGGDEFVMLLPGGDRQSLHPRIDEIRKVASCIRPLEYDSVLTMSVGEAYFPEDGDDAEKLLAEADRRMYKSKQQFRNGAFLMLDDGRLSRTTTVQ